MFINLRGFLQGILPVEITLERWKFQNELDIASFNKQQGSD
jgi:hypothetical protein